MKKMNLFLLQTLIVTGLFFAVACSGDDDNQSPTCSFNTPANNDIFAATATISVSVTATDSDGTIAEVQLWIDNAVHGAKMTSPYTFVINPGELGPGTHTLKAVAKDNKGAIGASTIITIKVTAYVGMSYGGGKVVYVDETKMHGLIAALADQSTGIQWSNGSLIATGATLTAIVTGQANTAKIVQVQGNTGSYAAKLCKDLNLNGYNDWFLPSKDEFMELYENRELIGGFSEEWYWTSSEENGNTAHAQHIGFGNRGEFSKNNTHRVRAVRAF